jgi:hypothetical protein
MHTFVLKTVGPDYPWNNTKYGKITPNGNKIYEMVIPYTKRP